MKKSPAGTFEVSPHSSRAEPAHPRRSGLQHAGVVFAPRGDKKSPTYPLHLGGVWMVGVRGYIGLKT